MKRTLPISKRGLNFETIMWFFTRLSALAMYGFIIIGMIGALVMGARMNMNFADVMRWAFMSNSTHVQSTNIPDIAPWANAFWRLVASGFLLVASAHGVHGLVVIADDYLVKPLQRNVVRLLSIVMLVSIGLIGLYVIWTA